MIKVKDITDYLESLAPLHLQESYDNCGLIVGNKEQDVSSAIVCLDCTEAIVDEAIKHKSNLIIAHHPIVFKGLKKINGKNYIERVLIKAIKNDIAIYAIHTNLDNIKLGVNAKIAEKLGLKNIKILQPKTDLLVKASVFCPTEWAHRVKETAFQVGAGNIGNYSECSFTTNGVGTFKPEDGALPKLGTNGMRESVNETKIEFLLPSYLQGQLTYALQDLGYYEEIALDFFPLTNSWQEVGSGMIGELEVEIEEKTFLQSIKKQMQCELIRHTRLLDRKIKKVAVCGGSGSFLLPMAIAQGAQVYLSADFKYHEFFDAEDKILIADIGHFESEQFTQDFLFDIIKKKFPKFVVRKTEHNTNPIKYLF